MVQQPGHFYTTEICFVTDSIKGKWCWAAKQLFCTPVKSYKSTSLTAGSNCKQAKGVLQKARAIKCYRLDFKTQGPAGSFKLCANGCNTHSLAPHIPPFHWKRWSHLLFFAEKPAQLSLSSALLHLMAGPHSRVLSSLRQQNFYPLRSG